METTVTFINATGTKIEEYIFSAIRSAVMNGDELPAEVADLFAVTEVADNRYLVEFAE